MKNKILKFQDNADILLFRTRILSVYYALKNNNVSNIPKELNVNIELDIMQSFNNICNGLDRKTIKHYRLDLYDRLVHSFPDEAVYPYGNLKEKKEFTVEDLMAYDAINIYQATKSNKKCVITEKGTLEISGGNKDINQVEERELKSIEEEYYKE